MRLDPIIRIQEEIAFWKHSHPKNFVAKACVLPNGDTDLMQWEVGIPGPCDSDWDGGLYRLLVQFPENYPFSPPICRFSPCIFHPNVFPDGKVFHPLLRADLEWNCTVTILLICTAIQDLLVEPLLDVVANAEAFYLLRTHEDDYFEKIFKLTKEYAVESMLERYWS
uniref:UBIQUITIN_CONJUGAT_2 domain-containing protein n=1 Tax=Trichuris muris TaxID=70415 RepID=A0A5S6QWP5_TRIMR